MTRDALVTYLVDNLGLEADGVTDQTPLFSTSLLDSFGMVDLIGFLEKEGGFRIGPTEVNLDNLDTIEAILTFVTARSVAS